MKDPLRDIARSLSRCHDSAPKLFRLPESEENTHQWRAALRRFGVPTLEMNEATGTEVDQWVNIAEAFSAEFMVPVVVFGGASHIKLKVLDPSSTGRREWHEIHDAAWLHTRQVALTQAVEASSLNQAFRRLPDRKGWIAIGWQPDGALQEGNGLLLAWSSPLPLRRIRDFAARCPEITVIGPDAEAIAAEVAAQGISVSGWRFAVK